MSNLTLAEHIAGLSEIANRIEPEKHAQRCREFMRAHTEDLLTALYVLAPDLAPKMRTCHTCWGEGAVDNRKSEVVTCPICDGLGYVKDGGES
jgi:DnaJ-class molecular chaperone